ncbi:unnamed protein product [Brassica rapa subsp. trilocularis]
MSQKEKQLLEQNLKTGREEAASKIRKTRPAQGSQKPQPANKSSNTGAIDTGMAMENNATPPRTKRLKETTPKPQSLACTPLLRTSDGTSMLHRRATSSKQRGLNQMARQ